MAKRWRTEIDPTKLIVDDPSGEIVSQLSRRVCDTQEEFIKLYMNSINDLLTIDNRTFQVLLLVLKHAQFCDNNYEGNVFNNNHIFKEDCRKFIQKDWRDNTINKYVSTLVQIKILLRVKRGTFILNPRYFAKGKMTPKTRLQLIVEYEGK